MGVCVVWWVGGWVGLQVESCEIGKNLIKLDLIEIIQFCLKIYDLWTHSPPSCVQDIECHEFLDTFGQALGD